MKSISLANNRPTEILITRNPNSKNQNQEQVNINTSGPMLMNGSSPSNQMTGESQFYSDKIEED